MRRMLLELLIVVASSPCFSVEVRVQASGSGLPVVGACRR
jgi:hypothetical protein